MVIMIYEMTVDISRLHSPPSSIAITTHFH